MEFLYPTICSKDELVARGAASVPTKSKQYDRWIEKGVEFYTCKRCGTGFRDKRVVSAHFHGCEAEKCLLCTKEITKPIQKHILEEHQDWITLHAFSHCKNKRYVYQYNEMCFYECSICRELLPTNKVRNTHEKTCVLSTEALLLYKNFWN